MSLTSINQNVSSINAQRNLSINSQRLQRSVERLSSGFRINRGADDPSGLIISELLRAQVSSLDMAQQNALQGVNLIKTVEGALHEVNGLLRQMRDLAVSAASDSNHNDASRAALHQQAASALKTLDSIAMTTAYGNRKLLDGSAGTKTTVINQNAVASATITLGDELAGTVDIDVTTAAERAVVETATTGSVVGTDLFADAVAGGFDAGDEIAMYVNGIKVNITVNDENGNIGDATTWDDIINAVIAQRSQLGVHAEINADDELEITSLNFGSDQHISVEFRIINDDNDDLDLTGILNAADDVRFAADAGVDAVATVSFGGGAGIDFDAGRGLALTHAVHGTITLTEAGNDVDTYDNALYTEKGSLSFKVGIQFGESASMEVRDCRISELGTGVSTMFTSLAEVNISTVEGANEALAVIDRAISEVSTLRGDLGAFQSNELEAVSRSLAVARENLAASESGIRDTDFGREMAEFSTSQILVQSAMAFLAQANNLPNNVLSLIRG